MAYPYLRKETPLAEVSLTRSINAPVDQVWAAWDDYADIQKFNPNLKRSFLLKGSQPTGLGALRQCDFIDGKNHIKEKVIEYVPNKRMVVDIYDGTVPFKSAQAVIEMTPLDADRTELTFTFRFTPKMGIIGKLMIPMIKSQFGPALGKLVDANKAYIERGETVTA